MIMMSDIAKLNNVGVQALESGKPSVALAPFKEALSRMLGNLAPSCTRCPLKPDQIEGALPRCHQDHILEPSSSMGGKVHGGVCKRCTMLDEHNSQLQNCNALYLYARPITIIPPPSDVSTQEADYFSLYASPELSIMVATVIFNLGLTFHLSQNHQKAFDLYNMTLSLVGEVTNSTSYKVDSRLVAGLLNNMGEAAYELGDQVLSSNCFSHLAMFLSTVSNESTIPPFFSKPEMTGMLFNTIFMAQEPTVARAA